MNALRQFLALRAGQRRWIVEAAVCLALARLAVACIPFRLISRWLGPMVPPDVAPRAAPQDLADCFDELRFIRWSVNAVGRRQPFAAVCLPRALAARAMCRRRGIGSTLRLGSQVGQAADVQTHAWLDAGGVELTGYPLPTDMVEIGCFPEPGSRWQAGPPARH